MALRFSTQLKNDLLDSTGISASLDQGVIEIYSGVQPASADDPVTGVLLGRVQTDPNATFTEGVKDGVGISFDAASNGVLSKNGAETWQFKGIAAGTAGWFRFRGNAADAGGSSTVLPRVDGTIARTGGDLNLNVLSIAVDSINTIDVFQISMSGN